MRKFVYPYHQKSVSAKNLAKCLGCKRILLKNSKFVGNEDTVVINWGRGVSTPEVDKCIVLNHPSKTRDVSNKMSFFNKAKGKVKIPLYTVDPQEALSWIEEGYPVYSRETLTGKGGKGIVILNSKQELLEYDHSRARVYTKGIVNSEEFRIHIVGGEIIGVRKKKLSKKYKHKDQHNGMIKNFSNGYIFARHNIFVPEDVKEQAMKAFILSELDFCAVDVAWDGENAYVLELNTAPGLVNSTQKDYSDAIDNLAEEVMKDSLMFRG